MNIWRKLKRVVANPAHYADHYYQKLKDRCLERRAEALERRDAAYFLSLKDKYKGQRGFVIGNGPSLKLDDLNMLKDEISIASNKIFLCYDQVDWRPTLYTIADHLVWPKLAPELHKHEKRVVIQSDLERLKCCKAKIHVVKHLGSALASPIAQGNKPLFSSDTSLGIYTGYTVTFENIQWAVHMGLNPIYLIGCDHYYHGEPEVNCDTPIAEGVHQNHFMPGYRVPGEIVNNAAIKEMTQAYEVAKKYGDDNGIQIINATRGGHLEVFSRASFDELFRCK